MRTPLGPLQQLDLQDHDLCAELLAHEKHQLIEGIVFESVFDQYVTAMEKESAGTIRPIPVETAVVRLPNAGEDEYPYGAFVWARRKTEGLGRFLKALGACFRVWLVEWSSDDRVFTATPISEGRRSGPTEALDVLCAGVSNRDAPIHETVHDSVRNPHRIKQSVWGYLAAHYGSRLGWDVVLPRIFINWGVQPWFGEGLWNLDRILLVADRLWHMEIKHKYPMQVAGKLLFGINDGELRQIWNLLRCGLRSLHVVTVKPFWERQSGSMYLLNNLEARSRAAVLARELTEELLVAALTGQVRRSGAHTSFAGRSSVAYRSFEARAFRRIGVLSEAVGVIAEGLSAHLSDGVLPAPIADDDLRALRLD